MSIIRDKSLAKDGMLKIEWVKKNMPLLNAIEADFAKNKYFDGLKITMCIHVEAKTAYLAQVLKAGGAKVALTGCNPLSTQDDVAAALAETGIEVYTWHGATEQEYFEHLKKALEFSPDMFIDDGGDITQILHDEYKSMPVWGGKGCAMRAKGLGAKVIICEVNPVRAMEAVMDGFQVMTMDDAASLGDVFITVTGCEHVIFGRHFDKMKSGAILCNAGHFDVEICIPELAEKATEIKEVRQNIMGYKMPDGRWINILAEGRLVNLAAGDGHPAEIMDMSFAIQSLSMKYMLENHDKMENRVYVVPKEVDDYVARLKLSTMGLSIDELTEKQKAYLDSYAE